MINLSEVNMFYVLCLWHKLVTQMSKSLKCCDSVGLEVGLKHS